MTARDRAPLLLLAGVLLAAFYDAWLPGRTLFARDLTFLFHPMHVWTAQNLQAGALPLWNPFISGGVPWLGQPQTGLFYPGNLLFWIFPFVGALKLFHAVHFFLSALGGYLWVRALRGSRAGALTAALLWSLNGFWRARMEFPPLLAVLAWTPWLGLLMRARSPVPLALAGALGLTAGHWPQLAWSGVLALAASGVRRFKRLWPAAPLAALFAAPALFPAVELATRSARVSDGLGAAAGMHAFSPRHWLGLLWPWASAFPQAAYTGEKFFWLGCFFTGGVGVFLAARAFRSAPLRAKALWVGVWAAGALLALGGGTPLFPLLSRVPPFGWVRFPAQFAFLMTGAVLVLATLFPRPFRRPAGTVLFLLAAVELLALGRGMAPTTDAEYFHRKPAWIAAIQGEGRDEGRLFMSPRAVNDMRAQGTGADQAWARLREKALSLGTLPYRVRNLNPHGFSLNPASTERLLSALYGVKSYEDAVPLLDRLGARWVAAPAPLKAAGLVPRGTEPWHLYERAPGTAEPGDGLTATEEMWDPGWSAWTAGGRRLETAEDRGLLALKGAEGEFRLRFRSTPFLAGLLLAFAAGTVLAARGFKCL